jgi:DNA mismatch endonuclease (patch repair protein)
MPDVFDTSKRSEVMSAIKGKGNKTTELAFIAAMRRAGITGWRRHLCFHLELVYGSADGGSAISKVATVRPDFTFRAKRLVVFVDGCFWHRCPMHSTLPQNNFEFWSRKLTANVRRDRATDTAMRRLGWRVMRVWEHEFAFEQALMKRLRRRLLALPCRARR